jgi:predicted methyltransferase
MLRHSLLALTAVIAAATPVAATTLEQAVAGSHRSDANKARDPYRHPVQTLKFFGIKPEMTVVEISPSGGWYTEILAPYLREKGTLYAAAGNPAASERAAAGVKAFTDRLAAKPELYGSTKVSVFAKDAMNIAPAGSADAVLTFRNVHNWYMGDFAPQAFKAFYDALKPGGTLGIVEHRLPEDKPDSLMKTSGYMKPSYIRGLAEAAGFKYVATSEINANPKDTKDYPKGVWTLPPNYAEGDKDKAKYAAIGESDRVTMKFVKPR